MIRVKMSVEKPNIKLRVILTAMRETKKNHSQLLNLSKQIKTVTILKHYRTNKNTSHRKRQKAKQTVKICQTCLKVKTKQKEERKKQSESVKGPLDVYLINESQQTPSNKSNKQSATTPTDEHHQRTAKTNKTQNWSKQIN